MGRLEKIVVLTVVFLIAVILGISLNETDVGDPVPDSFRERTPGSGPLVASLQGPRSAGDPSRSERSNPTFREVESAPVRRPEPQAAVPAREPERDVAAPALPKDVVEAVARDEAPAVEAPTASRRRDRPKLLNSSVQLEPASAEEPAEDEADGPTSILVARAGLKATHDDQYMLYTWRDGDTFTSIARTYYDSLAHVRLLRLANEGRTERDLSAGDQILVPVYDPNGSLGTTRAYTVVEGDTLSSIAQKVYGDSSKYRKIFDANRDVLADENTLALGQELRIPR